MLIKIPTIWYLYVTLICIMSPACSQKVERARFEQANPTEYVFNWPLADVKNAIFYSFDEFKYHNLILCYKGGVFHTIDTLGIFDQEGNSDDFYLKAQPANFYIGKSKLYSIDEQPLDYAASFHIHLESLEGIQTLVKIVTINPRVLTGRESLPSGPHFKNKSKYLKVPPSTIEEYEILYEIGKTLGEKNMPSIKYPFD